MYVRVCVLPLTDANGDWNYHYIYENAYKDLVTTADNELKL